MSEQTNLDAIFGALADPTRRAILESLMQQGPQSVGDVSRPFDISPPAISRHLHVLEEAGLIERRVEKQWRICRAKPETVTMVWDWLEKSRAFWSKAFDRLDKVLEEDRRAKGQSE